MLFVLVLLCSVLVCGTRAGANGGVPCVVRAELRGIVNHGTARYLEAAIDAAAGQGCAAVLVPLDTPGGMVEPTRAIVSAFLDAPVPVVVYVSPAAARAGSAGAFVALAAHVAAMAPGSNIGAAHPVMISGGGEKPDEDLVRKIENDAAALARAIAEQRDRNVEWAESAVRESASITASEALDRDVIDLVATSERDLLDRIDGREIRLAGDREVVLHTAGAEVRDHAMTLQQRALAVLGHPNLAFALMTIGLLAIMIELYTPGFGVAGVVGALSLLLALIGLNVLPVHAGGVILLILAVGFIVAELYVASYGVLALAGVACLLGGAALLLDRSDPDFLADASVRLSFGVVIPLAVVVGLAAVLLGIRASRSRRRVSPTGVEGLTNEIGSTLGPVDPRGGTVRVHGERWNAVSDEMLPMDTPVRVVGVDGLTVRVRRVERPQGGAT